MWPQIQEQPFYWLFYTRNKIIDIWMINQKNDRDVFEKIKTDFLKEFDMTNLMLIYSFCYPFTLPPLPYPEKALEPSLDTETMNIHHTKHHQTYVKNLNDAIKKYPDLQTKTLKDLLTDLASLPDDIKEAVRNNGGGHFNHCLYWQCMAAQPAVLDPKSTLEKQIIKNFGSFLKFQEAFEKKALGLVGSGWIWLCSDKSGSLVILSTQNHDTPLAQGYTPLLILDVWEHAYYLKYRNKRVDFVKAWWSVVDWSGVAKRYTGV